MSFCPFRRSSCGPNNLINFYNEADDGAIHVIGLKKGESCTYNVESVCGAPSFKISNNSGTVILYNEWQLDAVASDVAVSTLWMGNDVAKATSPKADLPNRDVVFKTEAESTEPGPIYGTYKGLGWKAWNNDKQDTESDSDVIGRRYDTTDNSCKLRSTMITVLATENDAQLLIEL